jgi:hypothetical protein
LLPTMACSSKDVNIAPDNAGSKIEAWIRHWRNRTPDVMRTVKLERSLS